MIAKIKNDAREAYSEGNFEFAFTKLWEVGIEEFVSYSQKVSKYKPGASHQKKFQKENWLVNSKSAKYFWQSFFADDKYFHALCRSAHFESIINDYFWKYRTYHPELEVKLYQNYPEKFIQAYRTNQVFLRDPKRVSTIIALGKHSDRANSHLETWKQLSELESTIWDKIETQSIIIKGLPLAEVLTIAIYWIEKKSGNETSMDLGFLSRVYNFFIVKLLSHSHALKMNSTALHDKYNSFQNNLLLDTSPVWLQLEQITNWLDLFEGTISPYCFNMDYEPVLGENNISINTTANDYYNFKRNGIRYDLNNYNYFTWQEKEIKYQNQSQPLSSFISLSKACSSAMLKDLGLSEINSIDLVTAVKMLNSISLNGYSSSNRSFLCDEVNQFYENISNTILDLPQSDVIKLLNPFTVRNGKVKPFSRFNYSYDVYLQPFLVISGCIFCPQIFLATNNWFYAIAQSGLKLAGRKKGSKIEKILSAEFPENWRIKNVTLIESNSIDGDPDIIITDGNTELLLQLKRTTFRLNPSETYFESVKSERKGVEQLNKAEHALSKPNNIYNLKNRPEKWIVSTSFENIGMLSNGCRKVNYFEVLMALRKNKFESLKEFIAYVANDNHLIELRNEYYDSKNVDRKLVLESIFQATKLVEPKNYRIPLLSFNAQESSKQDKIYDAAYYYHMNGLYDHAIQRYKVYLLIDPHNLESYLGIANAYMDGKKYQDAFEYFEKALNLSPDDPYILHVYIKSLTEAEKFDLAFKKLQFLADKYPLIDHRYLLVNIKVRLRN